MDKYTHDYTMRQEPKSDEQDQPGKNKTEATIKKTLPPGRTRRLIAIAAVIILALSTTAIALGGEIAAVLGRVSFGGSQATQVEPHAREDGSDHGNSHRFENRRALEVEENYGDGILEARDEHVRTRFFETVEEARLAAPFELAEPAYLPENVMGFGGAYVYHLTFEEAPDMHAANFWYHIDIPNDFGIPYGGSLSVWQEYVGPDATMDMTTTARIEKVTVGGIEAVLKVFDSNADGFGPSDDDPYRGWPSCGITWIENGFMCELFNKAIRADALYGIDTMIAIAESMSHPKQAGTFLGSAIPELKLYSGIHELPDVIEAAPIPADESGRYPLDDIVTVTVVCPILGHGSSIIIAQAQSNGATIQIDLIIDEVYMSDINVMNIDIREMFPEGFEGTIQAYATNGGQGWYSEKLNVAYNQVK